MRYRPLGESGLVVSVAGLGCNNFGGRLDLDGTRAAVDAAIDAGITLFDTVIAGAMTPEQVKANAAASDWIPSEAELAEIDQIVPPPPAG
jgi:aryl-alcohol dehydrogenase-like predicted oxidoreductase